MEMGFMLVGFAFLCDLSPNPSPARFALRRSRPERGLMLVGFAFLRVAFLRVAFLRSARPSL